MKFTILTTDNHDEAYYAYAQCQSSPASLISINTDYLKSEEDWERAACFLGKRLIEHMKNAQDSVESASNNYQEV